MGGTIHNIPEPLTEQEKAEFLSNSKGISISSDAFFPFRDSIDHASKLGVSVRSNTAWVSVLISMSDVVFVLV